MQTAFKFTAAIGALTSLTPLAHAAPDAVPVVKAALKIELPAGTKRIAIADVTGDKSPRLLVLDSDGTLTIDKVADTTLTKEDALSVGKQIDQFAVGLFAKDRPAVIVVPGAVYYRDGNKYDKKDAPDITTILGVVQFADGTETYLTSVGGGSPPHRYTIDLAADHPVKEGEELQKPDEHAELYRTISLSLPPDMLDQAPFPQEIKKGNVLRLFVPAKTKKLYGLFAWQAETSHLALINGGDLFPDPKPETKPIWKSDKLAGKILDIAFGPSFKDVKQTGIYVLEASGDDGKARQLEFYTIE